MHQTSTGTKKNQETIQKWGHSSQTFCFSLFFLVPVQVSSTSTLYFFAFLVPANVLGTLKRICQLKRKFSIEVLPASVMLQHVSDDQLMCIGTF